MLTRKEYKAVFCDLDGTLLKSGGILSAENSAAIEKLYKRGIPFVPATGRAVGSLPESIASCPYIRYVITSNGVEIYDLKEQKSLSKKLLPKRNR